MSQESPAADARRSPRLKLPPMYTLVRVKPEGAERFIWTGYIYDISETGMRFELDAPVEPGTKLEVRAMLPGIFHTTFNVTGTVVRIHDDDDNAGPCRMGLFFDQFNEVDDRMRLQDYLVASTAISLAA
ncbi:MAG: PilZ domain-containing protein [Phycisphaeraceae bacterium]